jgi:hypothetical protein
MEDRSPLDRTANNVIPHTLAGNPQIAGDHLEFARFSAEL